MHINIFVFIEMPNEIFLRIGNKETLESRMMVVYIYADVFLCLRQIEQLSGEYMKTMFCFALCTLAFIMDGCSSLALRPADFSWPIEIAAAPDTSGTIQIARYKVAFNSKPLLFEELQDSIHVTKYTLHIIRDQNGYYFITAKEFKSVYVFVQGEGALKLEKKIIVSEKGLEAPAFNQKGLLVQLVNEQKENEQPLLLSNDGIQEGEKK